MNDNNHGTVFVTHVNLPEAVQRASRARVIRKGRDVEVEVPDQAPASTMRPDEQVGLGSLLGNLGRKIKLTDEEHAFFENVRGKAPARVASFE